MGVSSYDLKRDQNLNGRISQVDLYSGYEGNRQTNNKNNKKKPNNTFYQETSPLFLQAPWKEDVTTCLWKYLHYRASLEEDVTTLIGG